jgi:hypothetical protein
MVRHLWLLSGLSKVTVIWSFNQKFQCCPFMIYMSYFLGNSCNFKVSAYCHNTTWNIIVASPNCIFSFTFGKTFYLWLTDPKKTKDGRRKNATHFLHIFLYSCDWRTGLRIFFLLPTVFSVTVCHHIIFSCYLSELSLLSLMIMFIMTFKSNHRFS